MDLKKLLTKYFSEREAEKISKMLRKDVLIIIEMNPIKVHPKKFYSTFCGSRMFLFSASPFSRNL